MIYAAIAVVLIAIFWIVLWKSMKESFKRGETVANNKSLGEAIDEVSEANNVRDRLASDDNYAASVRERFTRKE